MAHFAKVRNSDNLVIDIIVVSNDRLLDEQGKEIEEKGIKFLKNLFPNETDISWVQCSIWTVSNVRKENSPTLSSDGKSTGFRGNFPAANLGKWYPDKQKFINPSPYPSWTLDENDIWSPSIKGPNEEQCYYGSEPFVSPKEFARYPYNSPLLVYIDVINPDGKNVKVVKNRILAQWDEENKTWYGLHNDAQWRYWNGFSWNPSL